MAKRKRANISGQQIADRIGWHPSQLSRVLNGNVTNLTLRSISDILWATDHEPREFYADACEDLSPNFVPEPVSRKVRWEPIILEVLDVDAAVARSGKSSRVQFNDPVEAHP